MPTGHPVIREAEDSCAPRQDLRGCSKDAFAWLEHVSAESNVVIRHGRSWGEKRIDRHGLLVGFDERNNTVYQFYGCYWHGHLCQRRVNPHPHKRVPLANMYEDTLQKENYIESLGYQVVSIWECEWRAMCKRDQRVAEDAMAYKNSKFGRKNKTFTEQQMVDRTGRVVWFCRV